MSWARTLAKPLRVAVLNSPGTGGSYAPLFSRFLNQGVTNPSLLHVETFNTADNELPPLTFDGYILSGSLHGVYERDTLPWINGLIEWSRKAVESDARVLGICFGHQILAQALGGHVEVNPKGFALGCIPLPLTDDGRAFLSALAGAPLPCRDLQMLAVHGDFVSAPPPGARLLGGTPFSPVGSFSCGSALTFQGHPEFCPPIVLDTILPRLTQRGVFPARLPDGVTMESMVRSVTDAELDTQLLAAIAVGHMLGPSG